MTRAQGKHGEFSLNQSVATLDQLPTFGACCIFVQMCKEEDKEIDSTIYLHRDTSC